MTDFKKLRKIGDCHLISTLHAIELDLNEYVLNANQLRPCSECVLHISVWLNTFKFIVNHEFDTFSLCISDMTE